MLGIGAGSNAKKAKQRNSMGSAPQQASLREALRNRGGAKAPPTQSEAEDHAEERVGSLKPKTMPREAEDHAEDREKPQLDWLNLSAFAPTSIKSAIDKLRRESPTVVDDPKGSTATDSASLRGKLQPGLVGALLGVPERKPKRGGGLSAALQARGGVKVVQKPESIENPEVVADLEQVACELDNLEGESLTSAALSAPPLSAVREAEKEHGEDEHEEFPLASSNSDGASDGNVAVDTEVVAEAVTGDRAPLAMDAAAEEPALSSAPQESDSEKLEEAVSQPKWQPSSSSTASYGEDDANEAVAAEEDLRGKSPTEKLPLQPRPKADAWWMQESTNGADNAVSTRRSSSGTQPPPQAKQGQPGQVMAPPRQEECSTEKEQRAAKIQDLRKYWNKNSVGFAGPDLGSGSRLSKGEAEAALQRLITAGASVDFEHVRRLRKHLAECD